MARFEKGKGKRRTFWDTSLLGHVLSSREWSEFDRRLTGYRLFPDSEAARAEQTRLAAERIKDGFTPADDEAKAIAAGLGPAPQNPRGSAEFPVRQDVHVYNEGTGFIVTCSRMAGKGIENGGKKWEKAVIASDLIPVGLFQDDPFLVRVVAGESLSEQESEEWVGKIEARLNVPDGRLVISAVADFVEGDDGEAAEISEYVRVIEIPKGHYEATVYAYLPGVNGAPCLDHLAGGYKKGEKMGAWMRRTRPTVEFPDWLRHWCIADPSADPSHESEWKGEPLPDDEKMAEYVHFLLHLRPSAAPEGKAERPAGLEGGWFGETTGARRPERCPLGLVARDVIGHERAEPANWLYARDVGPEVSAFSPVFQDPPVEVELSRLFEVFGLAWLSNPRTLPAVRVDLPRESSFRWNAPWPKGLVIFRDQEALHLLPGSEGSGAMCRNALAEAGPGLEALPEGAVIELLCAPADDGRLKPLHPGVHRYRGPVKAGNWVIQEAFPGAPTTQFSRALSLAHELATRDALAVRDDAEAREILRRLLETHGPYATEENPPDVSAGELRLRKADRGLLWLIGSAAFALRFGTLWPVFDLGE